jgi:hypothetical protein
VREPLRCRPRLRALVTKRRFGWSRRERQLLRPDVPLECPALAGAGKGRGPRTIARGRACARMRHEAAHQPDLRGPARVHVADALPMADPVVMSKSPPPGAEGGSADSTSIIEMQLARNAPTSPARVRWVDASAYELQSSSGDDAPKVGAVSKGARLLDRDCSSAGDGAAGPAQVHLGPARGRNRTMPPRSRRRSSPVPLMSAGRARDDSPSSERAPPQDSKRRDRASPMAAFAHYLMGTDPSPGGGLVESAEEDMSDAWSIAPKRKGVYNLVQVPTCLERLILLSSCICADEFLYLFTFLPMRCAAACLRLSWSALSGAAALARSSVRWTSPARRSSSVRPADLYRVGTVIDFMHLSIFVFTCIVLASFDISSVYHSIRGQSVIKLYVVFNVMEIFDRLCCSFGVDILDSLGWTTANAVNYFNSKRRASARASAPPREDPARLDRVVGTRPFRGFVLVTRVTVDYLFTLVYVCVHATLLLIWVVTLNVAINTQNNALLTLLVSNNFVELKGAVFKSYKVQNLFQIACADAVERFQLTLFLVVMLVYAEGDRRLLLTWAVIFSCEVVVDWIKHAFVTKFNRIPHRAYQQFSMVICRDIVQAKKNAAVRSIGGSGVAKRIGFVSLPLGALVVRMASNGVARLPRLVPLLIFLVMLTTKVSLSVGLLGHAVRRLKPHSGRGEHDVSLSGVPDDDEAWYKSLANVGRYDKS